MMLRSVGKELNKTVKKHLPHARRAKREVNYTYR